VDTRAPQGRQQSWSDEAPEHGQIVVVTDNPVGRSLVELATAVGRRTTLLADEGVDQMPPDWLRAHPLAEQDAVVLADHDTPDMDGLLRAALASPVGYVAMLGSRGRAEQVFASLADLPEEARSKLRCPAGLPLGGRTPGEMALSILAQVVAHTHGKRL